MTPKEQVAMQQALKALESYSKSDYIKKQHPKRRANGEKAITALREALVERSNHESELMMNDGNYRRKILAEPELNLNCKSVQKRLATTWGYVKAEQADQEPVIDLSKVHHEDKCRYWDDETFCDCGADSYALLEWHRNNKAAPVQQAEQESFDMNDHPPHRLCECRKCMEYFTPLPDCDAFAAFGKPIAEQEPMYISKGCVERGCACHYSVEVDGEPVAVYSAPVRTKDLTDDEISRLWYDSSYGDSGVDFARAVIAAYKEKNK